MEPTRERFARAEPGISHVLDHDRPTPLQHVSEDALVHVEGGTLGTQFRRSPPGVYVQALAVGGEQDDGDDVATY